MAPRGTQLLIIDPQNDFCDIPEEFRPLTGTARAAPALPVAGAHADMLRLAALLEAAGDRIDAITLTLDSHHHFDIGHPAFWQDAAGLAPQPFTSIHAAEVEAGSWLPRLPQARERVLRYLQQLEAAGRYVHTVWPPHCEIGGWGHNVHAAVATACQRWEARGLRCVDYVFKGSNPWTEHYSAVMAEVPDPADAASGPDTALIERVAAAEEVLIAGEAGSHCVKATVEHLLAALAPAQHARLTLIEDCISPVAGFEAQQADFFAAMRAAGLRFETAASASSRLLRS